MRMRKLLSPFLVLAVLCACSDRPAVDNGNSTGETDIQAAISTPSASAVPEESPKVDEPPKATPAELDESLPENTEEPAEPEEAGYDYTRPVPESAAVPPEWFDDAVLVGDSVTLRLNVYCASSGALSKAHFLADLNWNAGNAPVADQIASYGSKKVYIMLGINDMAYNFERVVQNMETLVRKILERSPDAEIFIESVTPMTKTSVRADESLNNDVIRKYNERMLEFCAENGWYYVDVASALMDEDGYLVREFSGDADEMGIHFNTEGCMVWVDYLLTHVPEHLKETAGE